MKYRLITEVLFPNEESMFSISNISAYNLYC